MLLFPNIILTSPGKTKSWEALKNKASQSKFCSCKFLFCWFTKNIFCSPSFYINKKMHKKTPQSLLFMQNNFTLVIDYNFTLLHINKNVRKNTTIYLLHSYTFPSENQQFLLLKNPAAPTSSSSFSLIFLLSLFFNHPITPILQGFKRKRTHKRTIKEEDICILNKKNYHKKTWWLCKYTIPQDI